MGMPIRHPSILFYPDSYRRLRLLTGSADPYPREGRSRALLIPKKNGNTAGGDLHPALRIPKV